MSLSARIRNLPPQTDQTSVAGQFDRGYAWGHRDARHAAAELADEADAIRDELVAALELCESALRHYTVLDGMRGAADARAAAIDAARAALARTKGQA